MSDSRKIKKSGHRIAHARCDECEQTWEGANAQGVAARHAQVWRHKVHVEVVVYWTYEPDDSD